MKTMEQWKLAIEEKRKITLAKIEKEKAILNRLDLYLSSPDQFFKQVAKSKQKYEKKKAKPKNLTSENPDLGTQIEQAATKETKKTPNWLDSL